MSDEKDKPEIAHRKHNTFIHKVTTLLTSVLDNGLWKSKLFLH